MTDIPLVGEDQFEALFLEGRPLLDVRAPVEFVRGAFPNAHNCPLLDDAQRHLIGIRYQRDGQEAAISLGESLATAALRKQRLLTWTELADRHHNLTLYCFRGGLRSRITQQWLTEAGYTVPMVAGGYKALRGWLLAKLDQLCDELPLSLISGRTGSGKTEFLGELQGAVDLEGLAGHRGSSFGAVSLLQPSQIDFENALAIALLKHRYAGLSPCFVEDEGRMIGRLQLPPALQESMAAAPLWILECPLDEREERILKDYVVGQRLLMEQQHGPAAALRFREFVLENLDRIRRRLGNETHADIRKNWASALDRFEDSGNADGFRDGIRRLLLEYYDPMYDYQLSRREGQVLRRGTAVQLLQQ